MSAKIKWLLALFALGIFVAVPYARSLIRSDTSTQLTAELSQSLMEQVRDSDGDGLTDRDELYWRTDPENKDSDGDGFIDGEEVLSGHNPLVVGPNDWVDKSKNLTQRTVQLALGGVLAGDLRPGGASYNESLKALAAAMTDQFQRNTTIVLDPILIVEDTPETKMAYFNSMSTFLSTAIQSTYNELNTFVESIENVSLADPSELTGDAKRLRAFVTTTKTLAGRAGERAARAASTPTPRSLASQQQLTIRILRTLEKYYQVAGTIQNDPLQATTALQHLLVFQHETIPQYIYEILEAIRLKLLATPTP